jgi:hypothetical protein
MKPILDISNKSSFTVWESCVQRPTFSSSVIVGNHEGDKLQVIYDKDPTKTSTHALFYANVGNILAGCFIDKKSGPGKYVAKLELAKITELRTKPIQGNTVPVAVMETLHMASLHIDAQHALDLDKMLESYEHRASIPHALSMLRASIEKAMTPPEKQQLFWGLPRVRNNED